jgi:serine/threonine protein kinase
MAEAPSDRSINPQLQPGEKLGNYQVLRLLGQGGMGEVFEAKHLYIERRAAIKVLHSELCQNQQFRTRFLNEARAVNLIKHPGLVEIYEYGLKDDGTAYIVMEYLEGEALSRRIKRAVHGIGSAALPICRQIAIAIAAAHAKNIVHRDLKPDNVMLVSEPDRSLRVKVLDFGIAKLSDSSDGKAQTETGAVIGTPAYMAPEQCVGLSSIDGKADVYALGMILYELLSGTSPFDAQHGFDYMAAHVRGTPRPILDAVPELPAELANLVHAMIAKDKEERPDMMTVALLIEQIEADLPTLWPAATADLASDSTLHAGPRDRVTGPIPKVTGGRLSREGMPQLRPSRELNAIQNRPSRELNAIQNRPSRELTPVGQVGRDDLAHGHTLPAMASQSSGLRSKSKSLATGQTLPALAPDSVSASSVSGVNTAKDSAAISAVSSVSESVPLRGLGRPGPIVLLLTLSTMGIALVAFLVLRRTPIPEKSQTPQVVAAPRLVKWVVRSHPTGAEVVRSDGQILGNTPWQIERPADLGESLLTLRLALHRDKVIVLSHSADVVTEVLLEARTPASPATVEPLNPTNPSAGKSAGKSASKSAKSRKSSTARKGHGSNGKAAGSDGEVKLLMD